VNNFAKRSIICSKRKKNTNINIRYIRYMSSGISGICKVLMPGSDAYSYAELTVPRAVKGHCPVMQLIVEECCRDPKPSDHKCLYYRCTKLSFRCQFIHSLSPDDSNVDAHEFTNTTKRAEQRHAKQHQRSYSERRLQFDVSASRKKAYLSSEPSGETCW
jgi:hypothetical protein